MNKSKVYFIKEITPESLVRIYDALGRELHGKVAVKISTGEMGGHNYLHPNSSANWSITSKEQSSNAIPPMADPVRT